jgi:polynucleotide 5'-hydroxyl-kinase GRC3/NOL9
VVTGATDAGKSTLSVFLANLALAEGLSVAVVDGDLGQSDLGPPGSVAAATVRAPLFDLRELQGEAFGFVGATSPRGFESPLTRELARLCERICHERPDLAVVNTDGYVQEEGATHKLRLIEELRPDSVLSLEDEPALLADAIQGKFPQMGVHRLARPRAGVKSHAERALRRGAQYRRFLRGAGLRRLPLDEIGFEFLGWEFAGRPQGLPSSASAWPVVRAASDNRRLVILPSATPLVTLSGWGVGFTAGSLVGMFVALRSSEGIEGFGVVTAIHPTRGVLVNTPARAPVERIILSLISLTPDQTGDAMLPLEVTAP